MKSEILITTAGVFKNSLCQSLVIQCMIKLYLEPSNIGNFDTSLS